MKCISLLASGLAIAHGATTVEWKIASFEALTSEAEGATVTFLFGQSHDLLKFPNKAAFDTCDFSSAQAIDPRADTDGVTDLTVLAGTNYYGCSKNSGGHCGAGMRIEITANTTGDSTGAPTPNDNPTNDPTPCDETAGDNALASYGQTCVSILGHGYLCNTDLATLDNSGNTAEGNLISDICVCSCAGGSDVDNPMKNCEPCMTEQNACVADAACAAEVDAGPPGADGYTTDLGNAVVACRCEKCKDDAPPAACSGNAGTANTVGLAASLLTAACVVATKTAGSSEHGLS